MAKKIKIPVPTIEQVLIDLKENGFVIIDGDCNVIDNDSQGIDDHHDIRQILDNMEQPSIIMVHYSCDIYNILQLLYKGLNEEDTEQLYSDIDDHLNYPTIIDTARRLPNEAKERILCISKLTADNANELLSNIL